MLNRLQFQTVALKSLDAKAAINLRPDILEMTSIA